MICSIGFSKILVPCVFWQFGSANDCDEAVQAGYELLYGREVHQQWADLMEDYQLRMDWIMRGIQPHDTKKTAIYQTAYPPFFDVCLSLCPENIP